jgi:hypothetical protein
LFSVFCFVLFCFVSKRRIILHSFSFRETLFTLFEIPLKSFVAPPLHFEQEEEQKHLQQHLAAEEKMSEKLSTEAEVPEVRTEGGGGGGEGGEGQLGRIQSELGVFGVNVSYSEVKGRHVISQKDFTEGDLVGCFFPLQSAILDNYKKR